MITKKTYEKHLIRIDELLKVVDNSTSPDDLLFIELNELTDQVADYEENFLPVHPPKLIEVIKLRMFEMGLKQKDLAELLGTTTSRISEYLNGKRELTLPVAKEMHKKLNIDADIILQ
jgi:HTH-type transcriptional regulator / antitoxin HigA